MAKKVSDGRVLSLLEDFLHQRIMEGLAGWTPTAGTPQGAVVSPLLANIYLDPLDHLLAERGFQVVRYADDLVILCRSQAKALEALTALAMWAGHAGLSLHPDKTRLVDATQDGFEFLGYLFEQGRRWPRKKSLQRLKARIRQLTRRNNGNSLERRRGRGQDHVRWPNSFFAKQGLYSLQKAHAMACQSCRR